MRRNCFANTMEKEPAMNDKPNQTVDKQLVTEYQVQKALFLAREQFAKDVPTESMEALFVKVLTGIINGDRQ